jgi:beta-glucanase (GH16 family)
MTFLKLSRIHYIRLFTIILTAFMLLSCDDSTASEERQWDLVWEDNFEGNANTAPDASNWTYDIGTDWGNGQLEYDTDRIENVYLDGNGNLAITAREESFQGRQYTSGRIVTRDLFETTYGRFEARIKLPRGQGIWPAFWLLGADYETNIWPACGEIDIMEYRGQEPTIVHGTVHGPGYSAGAGPTNSYRLTGDRFDNDFNIFSAEWGSGQIDFFVNGQKYHSVSADDVQPNEWVFDNDFFIILNVAVGGGFVGSPDATTVFPQTMLVDYVRVYQEAN